MTNHETDELAVARATNQRLNARAQRLESELAAYRRAVAQWEINERGTYIPHASLRAIGKACGVDILGSVRHLKHFERVEQAEAAIERVRRLHDALDAETDLTSPDDEITRGAAAKKIAAALDGWSPPAAVSVPPPATRADDRAALRQRIAEVLWPLTEWDGDQLNAERAADAVLAVLPEAAVSGPCVAGEQQNETPEAATVHAVPLPGSNGISSCCGRPPCEFVGERVTRDPDKVTCTGPAAGVRQDGAQPCAECGHPKGAHREGDDPVTPGTCGVCDAVDPDEAHHDFARATP